MGWYHATKIALVDDEDKTIQNRSFPFNVKIDCYASFTPTGFSQTVGFTSRTEDILDLFS